MINKETRLNKVAKELGIGVSIIVKFLTKQGYSIDNSPNAIISATQYAMLLREFGNNSKRITEPFISSVVNSNNVYQRKQVKIRKHNTLPYIPRVTGKIDLNKLTTKEWTDNREASNSNQSNQSLQDTIKDIWLKHIEVQEQMLKARTAPISVVASSVNIIGDKLFMSVTEQNHTDYIINQISDTFSIKPEELKFANGYFWVDIDKSNRITTSTKEQLSETAERNYVKLGSKPIVDGMVSTSYSNLKQILDNNNCDYSFDKKGRLQISVDDLKRTYSSLETNGIIIPQKVSAIFRFNKTPLAFLKQICKSECEYSVNDCEKVITIENAYIPENMMEKFGKQIGLSLYRYYYKFTINDDTIVKYDLHNNLYGLPLSKKERNTFVFCTQIRRQKNKDDYNGYFEEQFDFDFKYTRLLRLFNRIFGKQNVSFSSSFDYKYDVRKYYTEFLPKNKNLDDSFMNELIQSFQGQGIAVSPNFEIGVDFNWQEETIQDVIQRVSNLCPYISLSHFENHRCNVELKYNDTSLNDIESKLRESFPSMQFQYDHKNGSLYFFQEYTDNSKYSKIVRNINTELAELDSTKYSYEIFKNPEGKEKYRFAIDSDSLQESLSDAVNSLKGCDFTIGEIEIGKLSKIMFPQLIFDISSVDKEIISNLVDNEGISAITPNLTGDLEKIARLKNAFGAISSGIGLNNSKLSDFIFDASKANPINDIEFYINPQSDYYNDISKNLLNNRVNESQKQAIIKTLKAEDLALIQGPPGTGKSTAIAEMMWQHIRNNSQEKILLTSETNLAVDNAIARVVNSSNNLVKPIRIGGEDKLEMEGKQFNLDTLKQWVENGTITYSETEDDTDEEDDLDQQINQKIILENWLENIIRRIDKSKMDETIYTLWKNILQNPSKDTRRIVFDNYIHNCNVVGATCSSIGDYNTNGKATGFYRSYCELFGKSKIQFDTVIQDESSKATPAELSLPLIYGKKNIVIGDHRQLPPMLDKEEFLSTLKYLLNKTTDEKQQRSIAKLLNFIEKYFWRMEKSHFQRLFEQIDDSLKGVFNTQYRMHPAINEVIKQFYTEDGGLECGLDATQVNDSNMKNPQSRYHGIEIDGFISPEKHVLWIDTKTPEMAVGTSRVNYGEVEAIRKIFVKLCQSDSFKKFQSFWDNDEDKQIGVISFYAKQLKLLRDVRREIKDIPIRISTVDRFQGMERNIIIVSMVRSNCIVSDKDQQPDHELYGDLGFSEQNDLGFAQSPNRLNVALSRAKRLLIIVGNSELFRTKSIYNNVYECIENSRYGKIIKAEEL